MTVVANTKLFNVRNSLQYYQPIQDISNNQFYIFAGRNTPWPNTTPLPISDSTTETEYTIFEELIFGKIVTPTDTKMMVNRYDWTSGIVYDRYDDQDGNLFSKAFFVVSYEGGAYHVFKCLDNAGGIPSTGQPLFSETDADEENYITADGYRWKYMYTIDTATYNKFTTNDYIPVVSNTYVTQFANNGSVDAVFVVSGGNNYVSYANGSFVQVAVGGNTLIHAINNGSSNNGFYTGSALYISSGTAAGQVRKISGYTVTANQYQVTVESVFNPQPDLSSSYNITPYVNVMGDGTGAAGIAVINTTSKSVERIDMISGGSNYTYADVYVVGNTGTLIANSASARAVIAPQGGHGYDVASELNANKLGISVTFANNESNTISTQNDYSRIGLLQNPRYANVEVTYSSNVGVFLSGEQVVQAIGVNTSLNTFTSVVQNYYYNVGNYVTLGFSGSTSLVANDTIYQNSPAANGTVVKVTGNTALVRKDYGSFTTSTTIFKTGNTLVNNSINEVSAGFTNTVFGLDSSSNALFNLAATNAIDVYLNGNKIFNYGTLPSNTPTISYSTNSTAVTIWNKTLSNTDSISINKYVTTAVLSNTQYSAVGTVQSSNSTVLKLANVSGVFIAGANIAGELSGAYANVSSVIQPSKIFVQTLKITGTYQVGSNTFVIDDYCQQDTPGANGAYGYIQAIDTPVGVGNTTYNFYLTAVKGEFEVGGSKTIQSESGDKIVSVTGIRQPDLVKYSGDIVYAENITAVSRSNTQSETIKLVLNFY
jgi:hypothetical protein